MEEKIKRTFIRQEAYLKIRDWIVDGTLEPGQQLRDKDLAEQLGVSRTPIREALLRLEDEGLVQTKPNSSTLVSPLDFQGACHLYSIVWTLESLALSQAFGSINDQDIHCLIEANERLLRSIQLHSCLEALDADYDFHTVFIKLSHNLELERIVTEVKQKLKRLDIYYFDTIKDASLSYEEHVHVIQALKNKDCVKALNALENNWKSSLNRLNNKGTICLKRN